MAVSCNISDLGVSGPRGESTPPFWLLDGKLEAERGEEDDEEEEEEEMAAALGEATATTAAVGVAAFGDIAEAAEALGEMAAAAPARGDFGWLGPRGEGVFVFVEVEEEVVDDEEVEVVEAAARESLVLRASCSAEVPRGLLYSTEVGTSLSSLSSSAVSSSSSSEPDSYSSESS